MASIFQFSKDGNKEEIVKLLKENSRELLFLKDAYEQTPLHIASFEGHTEIVAIFIKKGSKLDVQDKSGWTPLHCAASAGNFKVCEALISKDPALASVHANDGTTPFHYIVRKWDPVITPKLLAMIVKHNPAIVNIAAENLETPLHNACLKNCINCIQFLLQHNADINRRSKSGDTCLTFAIRAGNKNVVKLLLEHGVDNSSYDSAYQIASEQRMDDVKTMIQQCQQFLKIRSNHSKIYKKGSLNRLQGKLKGWKKNWAVLDGDRIRIYQSEDDCDQHQLEITLKEIEKIATTEEYPSFAHSFAITIKDNPNKVILAADDKVSMAKWILAIDGLKYKFFDSCLNQFLKGAGEWIVEGEVPEPVVFFLSLLRYSRLGSSSKKESDQAVVTSSDPVKQE
ncbi:hypothetical protein PPL_10651 [Heterostelium album PN500]|uniref:PH domain-containing protein n=1 Tax=Heterostelium pallidum (strain ATCC 26659 / Pp 5 / PN500) TaxID=670386 RepID=D3BRP0_HETP5|nr:hypothetical protein PPL_10651 [Heterostelium album PN500]EFA76072.1 hypothetical protein PPL_10651 [Heterostelium album PN500]|eukprot:XP_020428206.1 hypothetical protein PPL_10651 [Heterostelium album PN500]